MSLTMSSPRAPACPGPCSASAPGLPGIQLLPHLTQLLLQTGGIEILIRLHDDSPFSLACSQGSKSALRFHYMRNRVRLQSGIFKTQNTRNCWGICTKSGLKLCGLPKSFSSFC